MEVKDLAEEHRIRTTKFSVYLLPEEAALLQKNAFELDMSRADYLRSLIVCGGIVGRQWTMDKEQGKRLLYELNRIGNDLNQIAFNTNVQKFASNEEWKAVKENYFEFIKLFTRVPFIEEGVKEEWQQQIFTLLRRR